MNKSNRVVCEFLKLTQREYRKLRHWGEMYLKKKKRELDRDKSRHNCLYTAYCEKDRKK